MARGGIRIVMSRNRETYSINQRMLFDENYGLAATQNLKNKDIPEGGAKGTILPAYVFLAFSPFSNQVSHPCWVHSLGASPRLCFEKYVDVSDVLCRRWNFDVEVVDPTGCH